jgi:teichuronic acid biosynthesis glycosyltransferase TuaG
MTNSRCLVSVITPLYNTEKYIAECIDSVLNQTLKDVEMLVVDDGSRDRSAEIVLEIARRDSRVHLLRHPGGVNLGVSRTRRLGIMEASGEYIAYLDADDAFEPRKLERQIDLLKTHPACLLCHTGVKAINEPIEDQELSSSLESQANVLSNHWNGFRREISEYSFLDRPDALKSNVVCLSSVLVVAAALRSATVATQQLFQYEDYAQWALLATKGPFLYNPEPLTRYRIHSESATYTVSKQYLRHLYSVVEFLLTVHALTDNQRLTAAASSELLYNINRIREIYAEGQAPGRLADSPDESRQPSGNGNGYSWEHSALELQSQVCNLQAQVAELSWQLTTIRSSRVYRLLVKVRNLLRAVRPTVTR